MKKNLIFFIILIAVRLSLSAQARQLPGKVTDDAGTALRGVTVLVKGSKPGVQTNTDGNFNIPVSGTGKISLVFSYTGYKPVTITTDGADPVSIKMEKD